jgi:hypothetical protein
VGSNPPLPLLLARLAAVASVAQGLPIGQIVPCAALCDRQDVISVGLLVAISDTSASLACPGVPGQHGHPPGSVRP